MAEPFRKNTAKFSSNRSSRLFLLPGFLLFAVFLCFSGCSRENNGSAERPFIFATIPYPAAPDFEKDFSLLLSILREKTGYHFVPLFCANYQEAVLAFDNQKADMALLNTFSFLLSAELFATKPIATVSRKGHTTYKMQIIARNDGPIRAVKDVHGKKMAFVNVLSASGYILPNLFLSGQNIVPGETIFAKSHSAVVELVYNRTVDAGATYYLPPGPAGEIRDARKEVLLRYPDVAARISPIAIHFSIPEETVAVRKYLNPEITAAIQKQLTSITSIHETGSGEAATDTHDIPMGIADIDRFIRADISVYNELRSDLKQSNIPVEDLIPGGFLVKKKYEIFQKID